MFDHDKLAPQPVAAGDATLGQDEYLVGVTGRLAKLEQICVAVSQIAERPQCEVSGFAVAGKYIVIVILIDQIANNQGPMSLVSFVEAGRVVTVWIIWHDKH